MARATAERRSRGARTRPGATRSGGRGRVPRRWLGLGLAAALVVAVGAVLFLGGRGGDAGGPLSVLRTADFHALAFSPDDPDVVFFGHHNGLMRSADGGRTWSPVVERRNFDAMGLAVSRADPRRLYLAGHDVFQASADGGATWQPVAHDLPGTDIHGFAMSPDDPDRLSAFVVGHGFFASADGGRTWRRPGGQLPPDVMGLASAGGDPETLYAASMGQGALRSTDGGKTWADTGAPAAMAVAVDPHPEGRAVYVGSVDGVHKSADGGATWSKLPFPGREVVALAVSPARPGVVVAIAVQGRQGLVYRSEDGGQTWGGGR